MNPALQKIYHSAFTWLLIASVFVKCDEVPTTSSQFRVTIENLSEGSTATPLSSGLYLVQTYGYPLFFSRSQDFGKGLEDLAEDGNPAPLFEHLQKKDELIQLDTFPTLYPGESVSIEFEAPYGSLLNFATMFVESNDLFYSFDEEGILLFKPDGNPIDGDFTRLVWLWDAGTERNQPPFEGDSQPYRQSAAGTGVEEEGYVQLVNDGFTYPSKFETIRITVEPISN